MDSPEVVWKALQDFNLSLWTQTALAAALEVGLLDAVAQPSTSAQAAASCGKDRVYVEAILDLLGAAGFVKVEASKYSASQGLMAFLKGPMRPVFASELRANLLETRDIYSSARRKELLRGWNEFADQDILESQGFLSGALTEAIVEKIAPALPGMKERFDKGARFLDVGSGVGSICLEMCRRVPNIRCTGLEPAAAPMGIARAKVQKSAYADRIELNEKYLEDCEVRDTFDLAWLPIPFIKSSVLEQAIRRLRDSLKPGGWVICYVGSSSGSDGRAALSRLINVIWGGDPIGAEALVALLTASQFQHATIHTIPATGTHLVVACRST
jgi:SAM-dependent methyltransferase